MNTRAMKKNKFLLLLLVLTSCQPGFRNESEFYKWWSDEKNGLVRSKEIDDFKLSVKYMPAHYLVYNELKNIPDVSSHTYDSLYNHYKSCRTFYLTIEPIDKINSGNILFHGIESIEDFKDRVMKLNFSPGEFISLKTTDKEFKPVLSTMENLYNLDPKRSLYLVFADADKDLMNAQQYDFEFNDQIFLTGINHFVFSKSDIDNVPPFQFIKPKSL
jgi:hypothetical protein